MVPNCAWPAAGVIVKDLSEDERCGAVYVGGRVIVTAAHCVASGFVLDPPCQVDGDCPDLTELQGMVTLTCAEPPGGTGTKRCRDTTHDDVGNNPSYVRFGTFYPGTYEDDELRKSVQIAYCRLANPDPEVNSPEDFAYCLLTEAPNIEPVPIIMHCEVDAELGAGTEVFAVGFGRCSEINPSQGQGTKRWASTTLTAMHSVSSSTESINFAGDDWETSPWDDCSNGGADETGAGSGEVEPTHGDSGSGLYAQLSDGTWRLLAVGRNTSPAYTTVWPHVGFILEDPNVSADDIIPCHTAGGLWQPGPSCDAAPTAPDQPSGTWSQGATACASTAVAQRTDLCSAPAGAPKAPVDLAIGSDPLVSTPEGCAIASPARPGTAMLLSGLGVLVLAGSARGRRAS